MVRIGILKTRPITTATVLFMALAAKPAQAMDAYYMALFASERRPIALPELSHCFGTFAHVCDQPSGPAGCRIEAFTISWMPQTLAIRLARLAPECGVNLDLPATLQWAREHDLCVSMWGPYQIDHCLYERALEQKGHLENGAVRYKAIDAGYPTTEVSNCIHALSDIALDGRRLRVTPPSWGDPAGYFIGLSFYPEIVAPRQTHDWLLAPLGLTCERVVRRDLDRTPTRRPLLHVAQTIAHWEITRNPRR